MRLQVNNLQLKLLTLTSCIYIPSDYIYHWSEYYYTILTTTHHTSQYFLNKRCLVTLTAAWVILGDKVFARFQNNIIILQIM